MTIFKIVPLPIVKSQNQTKFWRRAQSWYKTGKSNECELFQRKMVENITNKKCAKTDVRLNWDTLSLEKIKYPNKQEDGFEWTEDFDGFQKIDQCNFYHNFKMICDKGGAQTRTLREVYHFVKTQADYLNKLNNFAPTILPSNNDQLVPYNKNKEEQNIISLIPTNKLYFINILDGDESHRHMDKFQYLLKKEKYASVKDNIFVGNMDDFSKMFQSLDLESK